MRLLRVAVLLGCLYDGAAAQSSLSGLTLETRGYAFVLAGIPATDPFYHGSALLYLRPTLGIGTYVTIPVRIAAEIWNFSEPYGDERNLFFWAKPQLAASIPITPTPLDSIVLRAGDLGRVQHGMGLALEHFEGQGADINFHVARLHLRTRLVGVGWEGMDDIVSVELKWVPHVGANVLVNFKNDPMIEKNAVILSLSGTSGRLRVVRFYGEIGVNVATGGLGVLIGGNGAAIKGPLRASLSMEYRHYALPFFGPSRAAFLRYFESLTVLDKPVNRFDRYQRDPQTHNVLAARTFLRYAIVGPWFVRGDLEALVGTLSGVFYHAGTGVRVGRRAEITVGLLNKIFQLNEDEEGQPNRRMFRARMAPLVVFQGRVWF